MGAGTYKLLVLRDVGEESEAVTRHVRLPSLWLLLCFHTRQIYNQTSSHIFTCLPGAFCPLEFCCGLSSDTTRSLLLTREKRELPTKL